MMTKSNTKTGAEFKKLLACRLLKESTLHHFAGFENSWRDGDMTSDEIVELFTAENFLAYATDELSRSMKKGQFLNSPISNITIEAKHLKFLGTDALETIRVVGGMNAFIEFKDFVSEVQGEEK